MTVNGENILAFDAGIDWDIRRVEGAGRLAGGLFNVVLEGTGTVAVTSDGEPVLLDTSTPTFADPDSAVAWSGGVRTNIRSDVSFKTFTGRGSGESFQIAFEGPGWVLIQPSEGPVVPPHSHGSEGGGAGIGSLFGDCRRGGLPLPDYQVDQASGDVDALPELAALDVGPDLRARERQLLRVLFGDVRRDLYAVAQLAVDLHHERDLLGPYEALVPGWPLLQVDRRPLPHRSPHLLGVVRRERREHEDESAQRTGPFLLPHLALDREQVVGVLHERGDGRVEPKRLEVLSDLLDRPVRPPVEFRCVCLGPRGAIPGSEREGAPQEADRKST